MKKEEYEWIFWTTLGIIFVLLEHNSTEPLFLYAFSLLPLLILLFVYKRSLYVIVLYLLVVGSIGRYTRYFRGNYASDTLIAVKDFIGYFLAGKGIYENNVMTATGVTPFNYLPFAIFWYLPARLLTIDLRFFEMAISCLVPVIFSFIGLLTNKWRMLPLLAIISLTPFLLDLSADGSNDNSAIFILLVSVFFLVYSLNKKSKRSAIISAISLGLSISFKQYSFFYLIFFIPFILKMKINLPIHPRFYLLTTFLTFGAISLPFIISSPSGFYNSVVFVGGNNNHGIWGWNIWVALKESLNFSLPIQQILLIRSVSTLTTIILLYLIYPLTSLGRVFFASSFSFLVFLILSNWTTYAYFTFLIPLLLLIPLCLKIAPRK